MERVVVADVAPAHGLPTTRRTLSEPLLTTDLAVNHYRLEPGERLAGLHAHERQEEVFVPLEGRLTLETLEGEVTVDHGAAVRFAPGEHKSGKNDTGDAVTVLAIGAPPDGGDVDVPLACPDCGHVGRRLTFEEGDEALVCPGCGATTTPVCPDCPGQDLLAVMDPDRGEPVSECRDCGRRFDG